jgi:hypothetical protein
MTALPAAPWTAEAHIAHDGYLRVSISTEETEICEIATGAEKGFTPEILAVTNAVTGLPELLRASRCYLNSMIGTAHDQQSRRARIALAQALALCDSTQAPYIVRRVA